MLGTWRESEVGVCRVHDSVADSVHQFGLLPSGRLEPARHRCAAAYRSCQHLPAHCRHVYPGFVCAGTVLAQCDHHIDVGVHGHRHRDSCDLDQCTTLAVYGGVHHLRHLRPGLYGDVLEFAVCGASRGGAAVRRRCLLHPRRHRLRLAKARPLASRLRLP